jgi:hypothetical protein
VVGRFVLTWRRVVYGYQARLVGLLLVWPQVVLVWALLLGMYDDEQKRRVWVFVDLALSLSCPAAGLIVAACTATRLPPRRQLLAEAAEALGSFHPHTPAMTGTHTDDHLTPGTLPDPRLPGDHIRG